MTQAAFAIFVEIDGNLANLQAKSRGLQNHLRSVLPPCRGKSDFQQRILCQASHPAMNIAVAATVDAVKDPGCEWRPEIAMQVRHGPVLDVSPKAGAHHEFAAVVETVDEWLELPEIIGEVAISHDDELAADMRLGINIRLAKPPFRGA